MKQLIKFISIFLAAVFFTACTPKGVQPIQSLSGVDVADFNLTNVNVGLSPEFIARVEKQITDEEEYIASQKELIENPPGRTSLRRRDATKVAQKRLEESENKINSIREEMVAIETDVSTGIQKVLADKFLGSRNVSLDVLINSFAMTNGGAVILVGGSDSMTGLIRIKDDQSNELLGEYHITDFDANSGLIGMMARGGNPRGSMIRQFSEKISDVLAGKYSE